MAYTKKTVDVVPEDSSVKITAVDESQNIEKLKLENEAMRKSLDAIMLKMEEMSSKLASGNQNGTPTFVNMTSKMDTPCSIIHLCECSPDLPTNIEVNGNQYYFVSFGERKTFRYSDIQNIVSKYRTWFLRGVFVLAEDCDQFKNELPSDISIVDFAEGTFSSIDAMSDEKFGLFINSLTLEQKAHLASMWINRYERGFDGYNNLKRIKTINKATNGLLNEYVTKLAIED